MDASYMCILCQALAREAGISSTHHALSVMPHVDQDVQNYVCIGVERSLGTVFPSQLLL